METSDNGTPGPTNREPSSELKQSLLGKERRGSDKIKSIIRRRTALRSEKNLRSLVKDSVLHKAEETKKQAIEEGLISLKKSGVLTALRNLVSIEADRETRYEAGTFPPPKSEVGLVPSYDYNWLPTGTIRWERKEVDIPTEKKIVDDEVDITTDKKVVSKAVRVTCDLDGQPKTIEYSAKDEVEYDTKDGGKDVWRRTVWKVLPEEDSIGLTLEAKIALAMSHANDVMFEEEDSDNISSE